MNINASAPPWGNRSLITTRSLTTVLGRRRQTAPIATNANTVFPAFGAFGIMDPNINPPRVQSWNVTLEKQLATNWSATANYLAATRSSGRSGLNPGVFMGLGPCTINGVAYTVCSTNANLNQRRKLRWRIHGGWLARLRRQHNDAAGRPTGLRSR
jgi:hypothetical protein